MEMSVLLKKKPNPGGHFSWMMDWENVPNTVHDNEAYSLYLMKSSEHCDLVHVCKAKSATKLLAFLRYDYKKILIRARYLYIDRLRNKDDLKRNVIEPSDLDCAYFEPVLLCFPNLEFLGRLQFPELYKDKNETNKILSRMLIQMGGGYAKYADKLIDWHRNALSHELRPDGMWFDDLNTEDQYGAPSWREGRLYLNIPHLIDSSLMEIENLCDRLTGGSAQDVMAKFSLYISKRFFKEMENPGSALDL